MPRSVSKLLRSLFLTLMMSLGGATFSLEQIQSCMLKTCTGNDDTCCTHYYKSIMSAGTLSELVNDFHHLSPKERSEILTCASKYISECE